MQTQKSAEQIIAAIDRLDLEPIKFKLMDPDEGEGWSGEYAAQMEIAYKRFLTLLVKYPEQTIAPTKDIDKFWHGHILDTMKYAEDCEAVFGYFLHHYPYFGMRGEQDAEKQALASDAMHDLYKSEFGEALSSNAAYCMAAKPVLENSAYCMAAVKAAYCMAAKPVAGKAAYCMAAKPAVEKSAYCMAAVKAAYCMAAKPVAGKAAYCMAAKPAVQKSAYCMAAVKAAYCMAAKPVAGKAAYCMAAKPAVQKSAYCMAAVKAQNDSAYCMASAGTEDQNAKMLSGLAVAA